MGIPYDHRASRFEEAFEIVRRLLGGERVSVAGRWHTTEDAVVLPRPARRPPIMVGSTGERVLAATLPHVNTWNTWYDWFGNSPEGFSGSARVSAIVFSSIRNVAPWSFPALSAASCPLWASTTDLLIASPSPRPP